MGDTVDLNGVHLTEIKEKINLKEETVKTVSIDDEINAIAAKPTLIMLLVGLWSMTWSAVRFLKKNPQNPKLFLTTLTNYCPMFSCAVNKQKTFKIILKDSILTSMVRFMRTSASSLDSSLTTSGNALLLALSALSCYHTRKSTEPPCVTMS